MTSAVLITLVILLSSAQVLACRLFSNHYPGDASASSSVFSIVSGATVVITALAVNGFTFDAQPLTLLCGVLNAAVIVGYNVCVIAASRTGPYSIQMTFTLAGNILIPTLSALIFDPAGDPPSGANRHTCQRQRRPQPSAAKGLCRIGTVAPGYQLRIFKIPRFF